MPKLQLIKLTTGHCALLVENHIVLTADPAYENPARVDAAGKRLATAVNATLKVTRLKAPGEPGWTWADICRTVIGCDGGYSPRGQCHSCSSPLLLNHYCSNDTCPYAEWPQDVSLADITLPRAELTERYQFEPRQRISIRVRSDDNAFEAFGDAVPWFQQAHDEDIVELAEGDWSVNHQADAIAWFLEDSVSAIAAVTLYCRNTQGSLSAVGFECEVDKKAGMQWLAAHRRPIWAELICADNAVVLFQSDATGQEGLWGWVSSSGQSCVPGFVEKAGAALDAVDVLGLGRQVATSTE